jgi:UDP-N-acetylmuramoyl-L-alanyl-D-glutamate--2,6-diaminopimelate ligase
MLRKIKKLIPRRMFKILQPAYHFLMAWLAALFFCFPSRKLIVIGVTGTAGKTSTVYLLAKMLNNAGYKTGFTSTAVFSDGNKEWLNDKKMTMPGRLFIQRNLRRMTKNNCRYAIVETTSEGIKQFRHRFINYDILVFTGLYPEHIESHGSFEKYKEAKGHLFAHLKNCSTKYIDDERRVIKPKSNFKKLDLTRVFKTIVVNGDDEYANYFLNFQSEAKIICSFNPKANLDSFQKNLASEALVKDFIIIKGSEINSSAQGVSFKVNEQVFALKLLGEFNAFNALAAYAVGYNQNIAAEKIKEGLESVSGLAGKLELINAGQNFTAIVDYSFEPKALEKLYQAIALISRQKTIHLLGSAGGGRDRARRPVLGKIAAEKADIVIVTNEDPYDEDPASIIDQVAAGAEDTGKVLGKDLFKVLDRQEAVKKALELAEEGDLVLFTGKGAEQHICLADGKKMPWDERLIVRQGIVDKMCVDKR